MKACKLLALLWALSTGIAVAGDVDVKLTTNNGTTKFSIQDSATVDVASVTSDGHAYFQSVAVTTGSFATQMTVGDVLQVGAPGTAADNYIAFPFTAAAAITVKQAVVLNNAGQVATVATASSNTVVGVSVSATGAGGQKIYVATDGIVTGLTCQVALAAGQFACTSATTAGRIANCSSLTTNLLVLGRVLTACAAAGTATVYVNPE